MGSERPSKRVFLATDADGDVTIFISETPPTLNGAGVWEGMVLWSRAFSRVAGSPPPGECVELRPEGET